MREVRAAGPCERAEEADGGGGGVRGGVRAVGPRGGEGGGGEREHGGGCGGGNGDAGMATPRARGRGDMGGGWLGSCGRERVAVGHDFFFLLIFPTAKADFRVATEFQSGHGPTFS